jgi:hypothetical protein
MTNSALIVPAQSTATNAADAAFRDAPQPPIAISNPWFWFWVIVIALALAAALFLWLRRRKRTAIIHAPPPIPPHVRARRQLEDALAFISDPKVFSIRVSDALRQYLEERFDFRAPERTTEEFLYELQNSDLLTPDQKDRMAEFLEACDLVKFAKYEPTEVELRALHASAVQLVNETEPSEIAPAIGSTVAQQT